MSLGFELTVVQLAVVAVAVEVAATVAQLAESEAVGKQELPAVADKPELAVLELVVPDTKVFLRGHLVVDLEVEPRPAVVVHILVAGVEAAAEVVMADEGCNQVGNKSRRHEFLHQLLEYRRCQLVRRSLRVLRDQLACASLEVDIARLVVGHIAVVHTAAARIVADHTVVRSLAGRSGCFRNSCYYVCCRVPCPCYMQ